MNRLRVFALGLVALAGLVAVARHVGPAEEVRVCKDVDLRTPSEASALAALRGQTWAPGSTLRVKFLEGGPRQKTLAYRAISAWSRYCNIRFKRVESGPAEIRVRFRQGAGSWSYMGRGAQGVPQAQETMNLGWLTDSSAESEFYVATHEAGHALGFVHGQNAPNAAIPWDVQKVYAYFSGPPNYWDHQTIYSNVIMRYSGKDVIAGPFDAASIMQYPVDEALTVGNFAIGWNTEISAGDIVMARSLYPFPGEGKTGQPVRPTRPIGLTIPTNAGPTLCPLPTAFLVTGPAKVRPATEN